jgi:ADP-heptose:LPS heptosyltransferase
MIKKLYRFTWNTFFNLKKQGMQPLRAIDELDISRVKRILAISSTAIGDTLFAVPALRAIKKAMPHAETDLLAREKFLPLFAKIPYADAIIPYAGGCKNSFSLLKRLRQGNYDICLVFHDSDPCPVQAARLAGIPFILRVGQRDEHVADLLSERMVWHGTEHAVEHRLALVERVTGQRFNTEDDKRMELSVSEEEGTGFMEGLFASHGLSDSGRYIKTGFQLHASGQYKTWPSENFAALAARLGDFSSRTVIVAMGGPSEEKRTRKTVAAMTRAGMPEDRIINVAGEVDIADMPAFVKGLDILVTNDTGPLHVAVAVRTPTVSLFVPTHAERTGPIQDPHLHTVIKKPAPCPDCAEKYCVDADCMSLISTDEVFEAVISSRGFGH